MADTGAEVRSFAQLMFVLFQMVSGNAKFSLDTALFYNKYR